MKFNDVVTTTFLVKREGKLERDVLMLTVKESQNISYDFLEKMRLFITTIPIGKYIKFCKYN